MREGYVLGHGVRQFTPNGFGNWFGNPCREAGRARAPHGLRKAAAARLAKGGKSKKKSWLPKEIVRYTQRAQQRFLARNAFGKGHQLTTIVSHRSRMAIVGH